MCNKASQVRPIEMKNNINNDDDDDEVSNGKNHMKIYKGKKKYVRAIAHINTNSFNSTYYSTDGLKNN